MSDPLQCSYGIAYNVRDTVEQELTIWEKEDKVRRLWNGDATLWTNQDEAQWLGWLEVAKNEFKEIPNIEALASDLKTEGYEHIVILGMGGSSLCPAMMAKTFGKIETYPRLHILDSTDPMQIHHLEDSLDLNKTFFIVSSKSGTTLEPTIFKQYFYHRLQTILGKSAVGDRFMAITDPGTKLDIIAKDEHFRAIFYGVSSIGGRYSALSNFGMLPSGLMGIDVKDFLYYAEKRAEACSSGVLPRKNPGVFLGVILGVCVKLGKNKITLITSPGISALGAWLEQLLAESTGKLGKGLIPVDQEPIGQADSYGTDRVFVYIRLEDAFDMKQDSEVTSIEKAGQVVIRLKLPNKAELGAELFQWEIATAVTGSVIGINPFNQPDVEGSKVLAAKLIAEYEKTEKINTPNLILSGEGIQLYTDEKNSQVIDAQLEGKPSIENFLRAHLSRIKQGDYVNFSAFIEMTDQHNELLQRCRILIRDEKKVATCMGFGPRFLHSTGQAYKGGPNTGVFFQITADHPNDIQIPNSQYSFGLVIDAQAEADFEELTKGGRRVLRIHLGKDVIFGLEQLCKFIKLALESKG